MKRINHYEIMRWLDNTYIFQPHFPDINDYNAFIDELEDLENQLK